MVKRTNNPFHQSCAGLLCLATVMTALLSLTPAYGQGSFNSGSTGANGPFNPETSRTIDLPPDGIFNFTTVNIRAGVEIKFRPNAQNTPVTILASGDITIAGSIVLNGGTAFNFTGGEAGPGGFRGGDGGSATNNLDGKPGDGPGGGRGGKNGGPGGGAGFLSPGGSIINPSERDGPSYGSPRLLPLIGGSGGGGSGAPAFGFGTGGGGGGGAILIASSGRISFADGAGIYALGGLQQEHTIGGGGSGGAIRLVANVIIGKPNLRVDPQIGRFHTLAGGGGNGSLGYIRVEAFDLDGFDITASSISISLSRQPNPARLPDTPQLTIFSVGGVQPANRRGSFYSAQPDVTVPGSMPNPPPTVPVEVVIRGTNIPNNTGIQMVLAHETGTRSQYGCTLLGSLSSSSCSTSITLPTNGISVITASVTLNLTLAYSRPLHLEGERVDKVEIAAAFGGTSQVTYITQSGRRLQMPE